MRGRNGRVIVYDRVIAACRLGGRGVGDLLRAAGGRSRDFTRGRTSVVFTRGVSKSGRNSSIRIGDRTPVI